MVPRRTAALGGTIVALALAVAGAVAATSSRSTDEVALRPTREAPTGRSSAR